MSTVGLTKEQTTNQILESIGIIVDRRLEGLEYDKTELCTIVDDSKASEGIYIVSNGSARFKVYSSITDYKEEQKVYITIPKGNYNEQKFITGVQVDEDDQNYNYVMPFDSFLPISDNLLECETNDDMDNPRIFISRGTNGTTTIMKRDGADLKEDVMTIYDEVQQSTGDQYLCDYHFGLAANGGIAAKDIASYQFSNSQDENSLLTSDTMGYTRLGVKADFKTLLNDIDVQKGTYGLAFYIYQPGDDQEKASEVYVFSCHNMLGNPYKYPDWFQQEIIFDISKFARISKIKITFFQSGNFYGPNETKLQTTEGIDNILVKNVQLYLGYDIEEVEGSDLVKLFTMDSVYYQSGVTVNNETFEGIKRISNRWLHKNEDGDINLVHFTRNNDTLKQKALDNNCLTGYQNAYLFGVVDEALENSLTDSTFSYQEAYFGGTVDTLEPFYNSETDNPSLYEAMYNGLEDEADTGYVFKYITIPDEASGTAKKGFGIAKSGEPTGVDIPFDKEANHNLYLTIKNMKLLENQYSKEELALYTYWLGLVIYRQYTNLASAINAFAWDSYEDTELMIKIEEFNTAFEQFKESFEEWKSKYEAFAKQVKNNRYEMRLDKYYAGTGLEAGSRNNWYPLSLTVFDPDSDNATYRFTQEDAQKPSVAHYLKSKYEFTGTGTSDIYDDYVNFYVVPNTSQQTEAFSLRIIYGINLYPFTVNNQKQMDILCDKIIGGINSQLEEENFGDSLADSQDLCRDILQDHHSDYLQEGEVTVVYSNDLTFMNKDEVPYSTTVEAAGALNIVCADGSYGNYFLYELDGSIVQKSEATQERVLNLYLNTANNVGTDDWVDVIQHADAVIWTFPPENRSMIKVGATSIDANGNRIIKIQGDPMPPHAIEASVVYTIKENYNPSFDDNTISCTMIKDNITYTSTKTLSFGRKTSNGTSATMDIDFLNNFNAIDLNKVAHGDKQVIPAGTYSLKSFLVGYNGPVTFNDSTKSYEKGKYYVKNDNGKYSISNKDYETGKEYFEADVQWGLKDGNKYLWIKDIASELDLTHYYTFEQVVYLHPTIVDCSVLERLENLSTPFPSITYVETTAREVKYCYSEEQIKALKEIKTKISNGDDSYYCYIPEDEESIFEGEYGWLEKDLTAEAYEPGKYYYKDDKGKYILDYNAAPVEGRGYYERTGELDKTKIFSDPLVGTNSKKYKLQLLTKSNFATYFSTNALKGRKISSYYIPIRIATSGITYLLKNNGTAIGGRASIKFSTPTQFTINTEQENSIKYSNKIYTLNKAATMPDYKLASICVEVTEEIPYFLGDKVENTSNLYNIVTTNNEERVLTSEYEHFDIRVTLYDSNEKIILGDDLYANLTLTAYSASDIEEPNSEDDKVEPVSASLNNIKLTNGTGLISGYLKSTIGVDAKGKETEPTYTLHFGIPDEDNTLTNPNSLILGTTPQNYLLYLTCSCNYGGYVVSTEVALPICDSSWLEGEDRYLTGYNGTRAFYYDSYGRVDYSKMPLSLTTGETKNVSTVTIKNAWAEVTLKDGSKRLFPKEKASSLMKKGATVFLSRFDVFDYIDIANKELLYTSANIDNYYGNVYKITDSQGLEYIVFESLNNNYLPSLSGIENETSIWIGKGEDTIPITLEIINWNVVSKEEYDAEPQADNKREQLIIATFTQDKLYESGRYYYDSGDGEFVLDESETQREGITYWEYIYEIKTIKEISYEEPWEYCNEPIQPKSLKVTSVETVYADEDYNTTDEDDKPYTAKTGVISYKLVNGQYRFPNTFNHSRNQTVYYIDENSDVPIDNHFYSYKRVGVGKGKYNWGKYNIISNPDKEEKQNNIYYFSSSTFDTDKPYDFSEIIEETVKIDGKTVVLRQIDYEKNAFYYNQDGKWKLETSATPNANRVYFRPIYKEIPEGTGVTGPTVKYCVLDTKPQVQNRNSVYWVHVDENGEYDWVDSGVTYLMELYDGDITTVTDYKYLYEFFINDKKEQDYDVIRTCYSTENYKVGNTYYGLNTHFSEKVETLNTVTINRKNYYVVNGKYCINKTKVFNNLYTQINQFTLAGVNTENVETINNKYKKITIGEGETSKVYYTDKSSYVNLYRKLKDDEKEKCYVTLKLEDEKVEIGEDKVELYEVTYMGTKEPSALADVYYCFAPSQTLTGDISFYQTQVGTDELRLLEVEKSSMPFCEPTKVEGEDVCIFDSYVFDNNILDSKDVYWDIVAENTGIDVAEEKDGEEVVKEAELHRKELVGYITQPGLIRERYDKDKIKDGWAQSLYAQEDEPAAEYNIINGKYAIRKDAFKVDYLYREVDIPNGDSLDKNKHYVKNDSGVYVKTTGDWNAEETYYVEANYLYLYSTDTEIELGNKIEKQETKNEDDEVTSIKWISKNREMYIIISLRTYEEANEEYITPRDMYITDAPRYGVRAYVMDGNDEKTLWIQPIITIQNRYPIGTINAWDGQKVQTNDSSILAPMIAAGAKNNDNSFTGLIMGDIRKGNGDSDIDDDFYDIGLYGFHEGVQSFGFLSKGTAFLGKSGHGRIIMNGNNSTLYNEDYEEDGGMVIDLDDATLTTYQKGRSTNSSRQIRINGKEANYPLEIGDNFQVAWNGSLYASNGQFDGKISASIIEGSKIFGSQIGGSTIAGAEYIIPFSTGKETVSLPSGYGYVEVTNPVVGKVYMRFTGTDYLPIECTTDNKGDYTFYEWGVIYSPTSVRTLDGNPLKFYAADYDTIKDYWENPTGKNNPLNSNNLLGSIGIIKGSDGTKTTYNLGLQTTAIPTIDDDEFEQPLGIVFESKKGLRATAEDGIYLDLNADNGRLWLQKIVEGNSSHTELKCNVPAKHQYGIYARFA